MEFQILASACEDRKNADGSMVTFVDYYGRTRSGASICVQVPVGRCLVVRLPKTFAQFEETAAKFQGSVRWYHDLMYFSCNEKGERARYPYIEVEKPNAAAIAVVRRSVRAVGLELVEERVSPDLRLRQRRGLLAGGICVVPHQTLHGAHRRTHCEIECDGTEIRASACTEHFPIRIMCVHADQAGVVQSLAGDEEHTSATWADWRELVQRMDPDVVVCWGSPPAVAFSRQLDSTAAHTGRIYLDLQRYVREHLRASSSQLDHVAREVLGTLSCSQVRMLSALLSFTGAVQSVLELARVAHVFPQDLLQLGATHRGQACLFKHAKDLGFALTPVPPSARVPNTESFQGGLVLQPEIGLHRFAVSLDLMSAYPSIIRQFNLCYSSLCFSPGPAVHAQTTDRGTFYFEQSCPGVLPRMLASLMEARQLAKPFRLREQALKVVANALYGFTSAHDNPDFRLLALSASITAAARDLLLRSRLIAEKEFAAAVLYGDTDSLVVQFRDCAGNEELLARAHALSQACSVGLVRLCVERILSPLLLLGAKTYAARVDGERPYLLTRGTANGSRAHCPFIRRLVHDLLEAMLMQSATRATAERLVTERLAGLTSSPLEDWVMSTELSQLEYKSGAVPAHLTLAHQIAMRTGRPCKVGDRIEYVMLKGGRYEDPRYASLPDLDRLWYLERLKLVLGDIFRVGFGVYRLPCVEECEGLLTRKRNRIMDISAFVSSAKKKPQNECNTLAVNT